MTFSLSETKGFNKVKNKKKLIIVNLLGKVEKKDNIKKVISFQRKVRIGEWPDPFSSSKILKEKTKDETLISGGLNIIMMLLRGMIQREVAKFAKFH